MEATNEQIDRNELLASTRAVFVRTFVEGLEATIKLSAENLLVKADRGATSQAQRRMLEARTVLHKKDWDLKAQMKKAMEKLLHRSFQTTYSNYRPSFANSMLEGPITLIETTVFEDELRFNSMTDRFRNEAGEQLRDLNIRIALLFEQDNIKERENPFRPYLFSRAIAMAVESVGAPQELHSILTDQLAEDFQGKVAGIYGAVNSHLAENGIAAQLMLKPKRSPEARRKPDGDDDSDLNQYLSQVQASQFPPGVFAQSDFQRVEQQLQAAVAVAQAEAKAKRDSEPQLSPVGRLFNSVRAMATRQLRGGGKTDGTATAGGHPSGDVSTSMQQPSAPGAASGIAHGGPGYGQAHPGGSGFAAPPGAGVGGPGYSAGGFAQQPAGYQGDGFSGQGGGPAQYGGSGGAGGGTGSAGGGSAGNRGGSGSGSTSGISSHGFDGGAGQGGGFAGGASSGGASGQGGSSGGGMQGGASGASGSAGSGNQGGGEHSGQGNGSASGGGHSGQGRGSAGSGGQSGQGNGSASGGDSESNSSNAEQGMPERNHSWLSGKKAVGDVLRRFFAGNSAPDDLADEYDEISDGNTIPARPAPGLLAGSIQRLLKHGTPSTGEMYTGSGEIRNLIMESRSSLNEVANNAKEQMTIDIVSMLFEFILRDTSVPAEVRAQLGRLQFLVLKIALRDESLLTTKAHPARMLVNRIGSISLGLKQIDPTGINVTAEICRIVEAILADETESPSLFLKMLDDLDAFIAHELLANDKAVAGAVEAVGHAESRTLRLAHTCAQVSEALQGLNINEHLRHFLENDWARVIEYAERNNPELAAEYRALVPDLLWSVLPKVTEEDRRQLLALLPPILKTIHGGMEPVGWPAANKQTLMDWLFDAHTQVLRGGGSTVAPSSFSAIHTHFKNFVYNPESIQPSTPGKVTPINRKGYLDEAMRELDVRINMLDHFFDGDEDLEEPPEAEAQAESEPALDIAERLRIGVAIEVNLGGKPSTGRLNWINPSAANLVLTLTDQEEPSMISVRMFQRLLHNDRVRFLESEPIFERAVESLLVSASTV